MLTIQLFQCELFGFAHETEYHAPGDEVESGVETDWYMISFAVILG